MRAPATSLCLLLASWSLASSIGVVSAAEPGRRVPWTESRISGSPEPPTPYVTEPAFPRLQFAEPLEADVAPGSNRIYVAERYGRIISFENDSAAQSTDVFLDLGKVIYGFAFHPQFEQNGYVYVTYLVNPTLEEPKGTRLVRFTAKSADGGPPKCDLATEHLLLEWPSGGHNGGCLRFGPDGMLYIATGDSSGIADSLLTGQDLSDLSGSILRIDVDHPADGRNYSVPPDNPFVGVEGVRPENWAYGLRQPWKMHFDRATGVLWTGNVGQDLWEQIFIVERGGNYGWSVMEGSHPFRPERPRGPSPFIAPIVEHNHTEFRSITGGIVYHGNRLPDLKGAYIYGDYDTGQIWSFRYDDATKKVSDHRQLVDSSLRLVGFVEDHAGEFALIDHTGGALHKLVPNTTPDTSAQFPRRLSETGLFQATAPHDLAPGVVPYAVNAPQWCDGAVKERYFGLPGDSQIEFETVTYPQPAPGARPGWRFPDGTVIAETISLPMEAGNPDSLRRIETRILHYEALIGNEDFGNQYWRGYTYVWNDDQTDAELLDSAGGTRTFTIRDAAVPGGERSQTWRFPSRAECTVCHNMAAKYVLGLTTEQANCRSVDPRFSGSQLRWFDELRLFTSPLARAISELPVVVDYRNANEPLDSRARAYLHANCSHCHRKWGGGNTEFQLLASLPLEQTGIVNTPPAHGGFFLPQAAVVAPGDPLRSVMFYRMAKLGSGRMPRLGSDVVDAGGVQLIHDWIAAMPSNGAASRIVAEEGAALDRLLENPDQVDSRVFEALIASSSGALRLMQAIDDGRISGTLRDTVIAAGNASSQSHVRELFEKYLPEEARPQRLGAAIQPEAILAIEGDRARGRKLFLETTGVLCKSCHKLEGQGTEIGPDLSQIGKKYDRAKILDNILNPSREIDPKYAVYLAATEDGRVFTGIMVEKTESAVLLKDNQGKVTRLTTDEIETLASQQQSLMPELLLRDMTAEQVADLLAYLSSLK